MLSKSDSTKCCIGLAECCEKGGWGVGPQDRATPERVWQVKAKLCCEQGGAGLGGAGQGRARPSRDRWLTSR